MKSDLVVLKSTHLWLASDASKFFTVIPVNKLLSKKLAGESKLPLYKYLAFNNLMYVSEPEFQKMHKFDYI